MSVQAQNLGTMKAAKSIPTQIGEFIQSEGLEVGSHLLVRLLADRLHVSRSPINQALQLLHQGGVLARERNRGCFLAKPVRRPAQEIAARLGLDEINVVTNICFRIAEERLRGLLPDEFSEAQLKNRYGLTGAQLQAVLNRIAQEGWAPKKPGYGWVFSSC